MSALMHHVSIFVRDMERSLELFSGLLSMEVIQRLEGVRGRGISKLLGIPGFEADMVFLRCPDQRTCLELVRQTAPPPGLPPDGAMGGFGLSLAVQDLDRVHAELRRSGWEPLSEPIEMADPAGRPVRLLCFRTDEGLMVELIEQASQGEKT